MNDVDERITRLEISQARNDVMINEHSKIIDTMVKAVTDLSLSVKELTTTYKNKERNAMLIGGFICAIIGILPQILGSFIKLAQAAQ